MNINVNGRPVGTPSEYETFQDFFIDSTKQSLSGYQVSVRTSQSITTDFFDTNNDGLPESYTITSTDSSLSSSGIVTWEANGIFKLKDTTIGQTASGWGWAGRLAYDAQGDAVGGYILTNIEPGFFLTPDGIAGDEVVSSFTIPNSTEIWTLRDKDLNGVIDHIKIWNSWIDQNGITQIRNYNYLLDWSDTTHFTARQYAGIIGTSFDTLGRPIGITYSTRTPGEILPITWLNTKGSDNVVATFDVSSTVYGKLLDTNGDDLPDQMVFFESSSVGQQDTTTAAIHGWSSWSSINTPGVWIENQTSTNHFNIFTGSVIGDNHNPTKIIMPSFFMGGGNTTVAPTTITTPAGQITTTPTIYSAGISSDTLSLVADPEILNVTRPEGLTLIANEMSGTAISDLRSNLLASVGSTLAADTFIQHGIDAYLATPGLDQSQVTVRTLIFSASSLVSPDTLVVDGNAGHQEALIIDASNLPAGSQLDLNNVDFAVIIGDNITIRGGAGANLVYAGSGAQNILLGVNDDTIHGGDGNDIIGSTTGNDWLYGDAGNDTLSGGADNDCLDGGSGIDTAIFSGHQSDYAITLSGTGFSVKNNVGTDGTDTIVNIEKLQFTDHILTIAAAPGEPLLESYRIYKAAFDRTPDYGGLGFWYHDMEHGTSLTKVAEGFINSDEFRAMYGANPTDDTFVTLLYQHVLGRTPDQDGYDFWMNDLKVESRAQVLAHFSESAENIVNVAGVIANGIIYEEYAH
jgi:hypothetical protein